MDGNSDRTAGLESADASGDADHAAGARSRTRDHIAAALEALEGCNKFEAQEARRFLHRALAEEAIADLEATRERQRSG